MNCKYKSTMTKKKAFTLIELLIVIAIIGILFIVLVSKVDFATDKAKATGVQTDFRSFQVAFEMVSKENAGFNTFGWDTGDNAGAAPSGYTYTNADKDKGDRIRNSYDVGDSNLNGKYDDGEVWTGRKIYTENWTGCYTLINPGDASDMSAIFDLETAINKNLDPKLHINIADDGTITMANGLKDPWSTQYHGRYITNASADAAAKWNTDASMAGSAGDNMDRGAILMYSNGANQKFGTKVKIVGGVVTATVSQIDADHPDNNKMGADDYVLAVVYTYTNGYGETAAITEGFSNNQQFLTGNGGNVSNVVTPGNGNQFGEVNLYTKNEHGYYFNCLYASDTHAWFIDDTYQMHEFVKINDKWFVGNSLLIGSQTSSTTIESSDGDLFVFSNDGKTMTRTTIDSETIVYTALTSLECNPIEYNKTYTNFENGDTMVISPYDGEGMLNGTELFEYTKSIIGFEVWFDNGATAKLAFDGSGWIYK